MGLFSFLRKKTIISLPNGFGDNIVLKWQKEIETGALIQVGAGQLGAIIYDGEVAELLFSGDYPVNDEFIRSTGLTESRLQSSQLYFINNKVISNLKWGTKSPIILSDDRFGMFEIRAFGTFSIRIASAYTLMNEIVGTRGIFSSDDLNEQLKSLITSRFVDAIGEANLPVEKYASNVTELSMLLMAIIQDDMILRGFDVIEFFIENISMPPEMKKELFQASRLEQKDKERFSTIRKANTPPPIQQKNDSLPPPLPIASEYYVAIDGQQQGPFQIDILKDWLKENRITAATLIWKKGFDNWKPIADDQNFSPFV